MVESAPVDSVSHNGPSELDYRTLEPWSVGGLLLGVLSPLSLVSSMLWIISGLGILANVVALRRIKADRQLAGRNFALAGLGLSLVFAVAPIAQYATSFVMLPRQARPLADQWFQYLREGSPEKALMLKYIPDQRQPLDDNLWVFFQHDHEAAHDLKSFARFPLVRTLLELGDKAQVRFYKTEAVATEGPRALASLWYTVTYLDQQEKKTFLVMVLLERKPPKDSELNPWRIKDFAGGFNPNDPKP